MLAPVIIDMLITSLLLLLVGWFGDILDASTRDWGKALLRPSLDGVSVRNRPRGLDAEVGLGPQRPIRLAQQLAGDEHQVGVAARDNLVRVRGLGDQADCTGHDLGLAADLPRERHLVAPADWNASRRRHSA